MRLIIVKLGGSVLSDKKIPDSLNHGTIASIFKQIKQIYQNITHNIIIVHGGGSFGHPAAKAYQIQNGCNPQVPNQILGLAKTHQKMQSLNTIIIDELLGLGLPAINFTPSSMFHLDGNDLTFSGANILSSVLNLGAVPVLYGDILSHSPPNFSILSGDRIIRELVRSFITAYHVEVFFLADVDGIFAQDPQNPSQSLYLPQIKHSQIKKLWLADKDQEGKVDVTGGVRGKLKEIEQILHYGIQVRFLSGLKEKSLWNAVSGEAEGTCFLPDDKNNQN